MYQELIFQPSNAHFVTLWHLKTVCLRKEPSVLIEQRMLKVRSRFSLPGLFCVNLEVIMQPASGEMDVSSPFLTLKTTLTFSSNLCNTWILLLGSQMVFLFPRLACLLTSSCFN